MSTFLGVLRL